MRCDGGGHAQQHMQSTDRLKQSMHIRRLAMYPCVVVAGGVQAAAFSSYMLCMNIWQQQQPLPPATQLHVAAHGGQRSAPLFELCISQCTTCQCRRSRLCLCVETPAYAVFVCKVLCRATTHRRGCLQAADCLHMSDATASVHRGLWLAVWSLPFSGLHAVSSRVVCLSQQGCI